MKMRLVRVCLRGEFPTAELFADHRSQNIWHVRYSVIRSLNETARRPEFAERARPFAKTNSRTEINKKNANTIIFDEIRMIKCIYKGRDVIKSDRSVSIHPVREY